MHLPKSVHPKHFVFLTSMGPIAVFVRNWPPWVVASFFFAPFIYDWSYLVLYGVLAVQTWSCQSILKSYTDLLRVLSATMANSIYVDGQGLLCMMREWSQKPYLSHKTALNVALSDVFHNLHRFILDLSAAVLIHHSSYLFHHPQPRDFWVFEPSFLGLYRLIWTPLFSKKMKGIPTYHTIPAHVV